jgi:hypothetical protein
MTQGRFWPVAVTLAVVCSATSSAGAMPPPVTLDVTLVTPAGDTRTAGRLGAAVQSLAARDYLALGSKPSAAELPASCFADDTCPQLEALRTSAGQRVLVLAHDPAWRAADHQVRCIGPDAARAQLKRVNLRDAVEGSLEVSHRELLELSSCMIGAIHAPPASK